MSYADALPLARIDLSRVRKNAEEIRARCGVDLIGVLKADAYGLGLPEVARTIGDLVSAFFVFRASEAIEGGLCRDTKTPILCVIADELSAKELVEHRIRPAVWSVELAKKYQAADPILSIDTGQQRFACPPDKIDEIFAAAEFREAYTHASTLAQAKSFADLTKNRGLRRHAAGSSLIDVPAAQFDAVRPGLALYRGAVRVTARLIEARDSAGPAGYSGFVVPRHGVILGGYSNRISTGVCVINGTRRRILEVGMQTAFVELSPGDKIGDEVVLLGDGISEADVATAWRCSPQEALFRLSKTGRRTHV